MQIQKYKMSISDKTIDNIFKRFINQTYKLLPMREEGQDWIKPLDTLIEALAGMKDLIAGQDEESFFLAICKLQGLHQRTTNEDFMIFRRTIFECLSLLSDLKGQYVDS